MSFALNLLGYAPQAQDGHWMRQDEYLSEERIAGLSSSGGFFPIARGELCAFAFAGNFDEGIGGSAMDEGEGRVSQAIASGGACSVNEFLSVADCFSSEFVIIHGSDGAMNSAEIAGFYENRIGQHLVPGGPIDVAAAASISDLATHAEAIGLRVTRLGDLAEFEEAFFGGDEVRPLCGCEIYYPTLRNG